MASGKSNFGLRTFGSKNDLSDPNDPFSKPVVRRRFQQTAPQEPRPNSPSDDTALPSVSESSPKPVFSPPVSLPGSEGNADNNLSSSDSEDEPQLSQSSTSSLTRKFESSSIVSEKPKDDDVRTEKKSRPYEFEEDDDLTLSQEPIVKRMKAEDEPKAKFIPKKDKKNMVYNHKWNMNFDDEDEDVLQKKKEEIKPAATFSVPTSSKKVEPAISAYQRNPIYSRQGSSRVRNVKEAHEILESGEHDDFKQDLEYILSTLNKNASANVKCLSAISLARKCISTEFRQFCRSEGAVGHIFKAFTSAPENDLFALTAAAVIYLLVRDFSTLKVDASTLRLFAQLLRIEKIDNSNDDKQRVTDMLWEVFEGYKNKSQVGDKKIAFSITKEEITPSTLVLEALTFLISRCSGDERLKTELLNLGAVQWFVLKVEENVTKFEDNTLSAEEFDHSRKILDRCFRMLELCSQLHKKNQAFLISHRSSILIHKCSRFLFVLSDRLASFEERSNKSAELLHCLGMMSRLLINLSHDNELCCSKLGQIPGFIPACLTAFTYLAPKFAPVDKKFDLHVIMSSLLVNLVERCNANRKSLIGVNIKMYQDDDTVEEKDSLEVLSKLFAYHEGNAKTIDEDLDKELAFEEPAEEEEEGSSDEEDGARKDGRLDRNKLEAMGEEDMVNAIQQAMNKASAHMEDSVIASYLALLIGCLLQQNEELVDEVKKFMPGKNMAKMIEQLERFLEFMKLATKQKNGTENHGCRSIEKIIDFLDRIN